MAIEAAFYRYNSNNYHDNDYWDLHARAVLSPNPCWMPHYISTFLGMSSHTVWAEPSCRVRVLLAFISLEHCIHTYYMYTGISYHIAPYRLLLLFLMGFSLLYALNCLCDFFRHLKSGKLDTKLDCQCVYDWIDTDACLTEMLHTIHTTTMSREKSTHHFMLAFIFVGLYFLWPQKQWQWQQQQK